MRALSLTSIVLCFPILAIADEIKAPKSLCGPSTGLATAKIEGKQLVVTLRMVNVVCEIQTRQQTEFRDVKRTVNGKEVIEKEPVQRLVTVQVPRIQGFREVKLTGKDVKASNVSGGSIPQGKLVKLLATECPVLLNTCPDAVDAFYLAAVKNDTVILTVDCEKIYPAPAAAAPIAAPVAPPVKSP